jgi:hypothetical protein
MKRHFWDRWSSDYLSRMQQRPKWRTAAENLKEGQLVLLMDENYPPLKWPLARITKVYPGDDGQVRVATIKTRGIYTTVTKGKRKGGQDLTFSVLDRPITKLVPLPLSDDDLNITSLLVRSEPNRGEDVRDTEQTDI